VGLKTMVGNICGQKVGQFGRSPVFLKDIVEAKDGNAN